VSSVAGVDPDSENSGIDVDKLGSSMLIRRDSVAFNLSLFHRFPAHLRLS